MNWTSIACVPYQGAAADDMDIVDEPIVNSHDDGLQTDEPPATGYSGVVPPPTQAPGTLAG